MIKILTEIILRYNTMNQQKPGTLNKARTESPIRNSRSPYDIMTLNPIKRKKLIVENTNLNDSLN